MTAPTDAEPGPGANGDADDQASTVPPGWSAAEIATLARLAETFVAGRAARRAVMAAEALSLALDPSQVRQLRLVLRLLESRPANLALAGRPVRFGDLDPAARERYLLDWGRSRLGLRRSAFAAYRRLLSFLAYGDPGDAADPNPNLATIGYRPDDPGLTVEPTTIVPFALPPSADGDEAVMLEADVVVVGSGAGGGVVARAAAEAGRSVVVLEAGPFVPEPAMPRSELDAFDRLYLDHGLTASWDGSVSILAGAGVGGGTTINWMTSIVAPDPVRRGWVRAHGIDGFDGAEGDADYAAIGDELGITETAPIPPKDALLIRGAQACGLDAGPTRRNAVGCEACGSCPFGCRAGRKRSGLRAHLEDACRAGARLIPDVRVDRVIVEGGRAVGVEATVGWEAPSSRAVAAGGHAVPRRRLVVRAPQVVLAAGALRTPVVLERSGVRHPAAGRYLLLHPVSVLAGIFAEPIDMWRGPAQGARSLAFVDGVRGRNGYVIESAPGHPGLIALALPWEGRAANAALMARIRHVAPLIAVGRDGGTGRVRATASGGARIDYRLDRVGVTTLRHGLMTMARIARAAGALEMVAAGTPGLWHRPLAAGPGDEARAFAAFEARLARFDFGPNRGAVFSAHQMGTARFGSDPKRHACDPGGRVRSGAGGGAGGRDAVVPGLYVADTSLFPTGIGVNPMLTVMALARRVSRTVLAEA